MKRILLLVTAALIMSGCERLPPDPVVRAVSKQYEVVGIDPPKHFYVDFKEVGTGYVYKHQYVSKHCNAYKKLQLGSTWTLTETVYQGKNGEYVKLEGVAYEFCKKIEAL